jgi:hypothetical protein
MVVITMTTMVITMDTIRETTTKVDSMINTDQAATGLMLKIAMVTMAVTTEAMVTPRTMVDTTTTTMDRIIKPINHTMDMDLMHTSDIIRLE